MFVKKGVVVPAGGVGEIDEDSCGYPGAIVRNDKVYLYYTGWDLAYDWTIALAISEDGMNFIKKGVVVPRGGAGEIDEAEIFGSKPLALNDKIYLYYVGWNTTYRIALAISEDGMNFIKKGVVVPLGGAGEIDSQRTTDIAPIVFNDKIYLYYTGFDGTNNRIALAISEDGMNFIKKGVVVPLGGAGEIDDRWTFGPYPVLRNDKIYLYYDAWDDVRDRRALAISNDGINFTKKGIVQPLGGAGEIDERYTGYSSELSINDKIHSYYTPKDSGFFDRIGLTISEDGM